MNADLPLMYEVKRTFPMSPRVSLGDIVDATNWRNRELLARQGYIIPVQTEPKPEKTETKKADSKPSEKADPKEQKKQPSAKNETKKAEAKKAETKSEAPAKPKKPEEKKAEGK